MKKPLFALKYGPTFFIDFCSDVKYQVVLFYVISDAI